MWFKLSAADFSANNLGTMSSISKSYKISTDNLIGLSVTPTSIPFETEGSSVTKTLTFTVKSGYKFTSGSTIKLNTSTIYTANSDIAAGGTFTASITINANASVSGTATVVSGGNTGDPVNPPSGDGIAVYMTDKTLFGQSIMWYQDSFKLMTGGTVETKYKSQLVACDVSNYVGQNIKITANQAVIDGAYYAFFLNDIIYTGWAPEDLPSKTSGATSTFNDNMIVEKFVISTENEVTNTLTKTVPAGAKYLYFANFNQKQDNIPNVELA